VVLEVEGSLCLDLELRLPAWGVIASQDESTIANT
jgi:hypothetical protein